MQVILNFINSSFFMDIEVIRVLEKERTNLQLKLSLVNQAIEAYRQKSMEAGEIQKTLFIHNNNDADNPAQLIIDKYYTYDSSQPIRKKILHIIARENRFLHVREIAAIASNLEGGLPVSTLIKKISPALCVLKASPDSNIISVAIANSHFNTFWGSRNWLDKDGNIQAVHMYNESQLSGFKKEKYSI
jgi:hypothetical protein